MYIKSNKHITVTCPIHGDFEVTPNHFLNGRGCPKCGKNHRYTTTEFIEKLVSIYGDKYYYDKVDYKATHEHILIGCKTHGYFSVQPANLLKGEGCPICNESKLEKEINIFLTENGLKFTTQKRFKWLGRQSLDFYLPDYNIAIECQGIQHFQPVNFKGIKDNSVDESFNDLIKRDKCKKELCEKNGVYLLYYANYEYNFPYEVITNKQKLLTKILNRND